jgi:predicted ArsR family transcriptional regulator
VAEPVTRLQVWELLRKHGPMTMREVRARIGETPHSCRRPLLSLVADGCATVEGNTWHRKFTATRRRPKPQRFNTNDRMTIEQLTGLAKGRVLGLHAIAAKRGTHYVPRPTHPLEVHWGRGCEGRAQCRSATQH